MYEKIILIILALILVLIVFDILTTLIRLRVNGVINGCKLIFLRLKINRLFKSWNALFPNIEYRINGYSVEKTNAKKRILVVGDCTAIAPAVDPEDSIAGRLAQMFDVSIVNVAISGAKTGEMIDSVKKISDQKFDLAIVHAGNNDIWGFTKLKILDGEVNELLSLIKAVSKDVIIFRGGNFGTFPIFPHFLRGILQRRSRKVRELFQKHAKEKSILYIEMFMTRENDIFLKNPYFYYYWDLTHLNKNGYDVWYDYLLEEMNKNNISLDPYTF